MKVTQILDDMDNKLEADYGTLKFAVEGTHYELDVSTASFERFKKALSPFIKNATEVDDSLTLTRHGQPARGDLDAVRAWAAKSGIEVAPRGRIKQSVVDAYDLWKSTQDSEKATAKA